MSPTARSTIDAADDRFSALLDAAVDAIVLIDPQGRIQRFSSAAQSLFGYDEAEVIGHNVNMLMPAPYRGEHDGYLQRYLSTQEPRIIGIGREVTAQRRDGTTFPVDLSVGEYRSGGVHGFVGILRDISERKAQERLLQRRTEELRLMFEHAPTAMATTDPQGRLLAVNQAGVELLQHVPEFLSGRRLADLVAPGDRHELDQMLATLPLDGDFMRRELRLLRGDGSTLHAAVHAAIARDANGQPQMMIAEILDLSELQAATREVSELRERLTHVARIGTLGEMVSGIAHELNQPLTAIANYASAARRMLESGRMQPAELPTVLEKISGQAERAGQVIRGLRALMRKGETTREAMDCNQLVLEVARLNEYEIRQHNFRLLLELADDLPPAMGDGVQIQQVLLNLIRNALDAMIEHARGDHIIISSMMEGPWIVVRVFDSGAGIDEITAARLFEPFFTSKKEGIGLGLSICQSIMTAHGGQLGFESNALGGTTFSLRLPPLDTWSEDE
jgi:two-component system sensor kinase FixL